MNFNVEKTTQECIEWIKNWFKTNGDNCCAVIGISGGKDSSVVAKLCTEALGKDRVVGVLMPNGEQKDIDVAKQVCGYLDIKNHTINIYNCVVAVMDELYDSDITPTEQSKVNLPPRIRMSVLYSVAQSLNGRVANTCNLSEDWVGYSTRYGDSVGDFSPLSNLTVTEVKEIGKYLGLPNMFIDKVPSDGLSGKTDEENLGFTYDTLDAYIRSGFCNNLKDKKKIDFLNKKNRFKLELMDSFPYNY